MPSIRFIPFCSSLKQTVKFCIEAECPHTQRQRGLRCAARVGPQSEEQEGTSSGSNEGEERGGGEVVVFDTVVARTLWSTALIPHGHMHRHKHSST